MTAILPPSADVANYTVAVPSATVTSDLAADEAIVLSFDRCVDWLLTYHESTDDAGLKALVEDVLDDVRVMGPDAQAFADPELAPVILAALASVETAFAIAA